MHIITNMVGLFFLGRYVEQLYGSKEFLRIYLVMIILGSLCFALGSAAINAIAHQDTPYTLLGASGAVSGVTILFVLNFPNVTLMLFPIPIPIKAWVIGVLLVVYNLFGAIAQIAATWHYGVHLAGIAFAWLYFQQHWNLGRFFGNIFRMPKFPSRPKFRIHHPDEESEEAGSERRSRSHPGKNLPRRRRQPHAKGTPNPGNRQPAISKPAAIKSRW